MALYLITGISTSGKSSIAKYLAENGYEAYDTEHNGISAWYNKSTGEKAADFGKAPERTNEWLVSHEWLIDEQWATQKKEESKNKDIFLCGGGANEPKIRDMCDKVFWLKTNEKTIRSRVNNKRDHTYGTLDHEMDLILSRNTHKEKEYTNYGAIIIDATQPLNVVIQDILSRL